MGQYYDIVNFNQKLILVLSQYNAAKLREFYSEKGYEHAITNKLADEWRGDHVILLGDYAGFDDAPPAIRDAVHFLRDKYQLSECSQDWISDMAEQRGFADIEALEVEGNTTDNGLRYAYNLGLKQYIDLSRYSGVSSKVACPLVLLLTLGNGLGGGDYQGSDEEYVGSWITTADTIRMESQLLNGDFTEIQPWF